MQSGKYLRNDEIVVTTWKAPDADGDGDVVWREKFAPGGQNMGREQVRDNNGQPVKEYKPPTGFRNFPSFDHTSHFLRFDQTTGEALRSPDGTPTEIQPGSILLEYADGNSKLITDEYEVYLFEQSHKRVGGESAPAAKK